MATAMQRSTFALLAALLLFACEDKKKPVSAAAPSGETTASAEPTATTAPVEAYPPGMAPPEDAGNDAEPAEPKTGVCAFNESGYDGQDTKSNEKLIVKIKNDRIVAVEYTYRGSYALDGKTDQLDIPLVENKWLEFEVPMTSGHKIFKLKLKGNNIDLKGTATQDADGDCQWEKLEPEKDSKKDSKKKR